MVVGGLCMAVNTILHDTCWQSICNIHLNDIESVIPLCIPIHPLLSTLNGAPAFWSPPIFSVTFSAPISILFLLIETSSTVGLGRREWLGFFFV